MTRMTLIALTALHAGLAVVLTLYPFIVRSSAYDGVFVTVALLIVAHWIVLDYDCLISVYEKRLVDEGYVAGSAPFRQWWMDSIGDEDIVMSTRIVFWGAIAASVIADAALDSEVRSSGSTRPASPPGAASGGEGAPRRRARRCSPRPRHRPPGTGCRSFSLRVGASAGPHPKQKLDQNTGIYCDPPGCIVIHGDVL